MLRDWKKQPRGCFCRGLNPSTITEGRPKSIFGVHCVFGTLPPHYYCKSGRWEHMEFVFDNDNEGIPDVVGNTSRFVVCTSRFQCLRTTDRLWQMLFRVLTLGSWLITPLFGRRYVRIYIYILEYTKHDVFFSILFTRRCVIAHIILGW